MEAMRTESQQVTTAPRAGNIGIHHTRLHLGFVSSLSDWLRRWCYLCRPITEQRAVKLANSAKDGKHDDDHTKLMN